MYRLPDVASPLVFPDDIVTTPEGLLAIGGNLHPETLVDAYSKGIFPWYSDMDPILWWHPDPRSVLLPNHLYISSKIRRLIKKTWLAAYKDSPDFSPNFSYTITINRDFDSVIRECADKRGPQRTGTWITNAMIEAYKTLHLNKFAHSVEVWNKDHQLVGGLYGIALGRVFFGESMFSHENNASKIALFWLNDFLQKNDFLLIDCQVNSPHIESLGATKLSRVEFLDILTKGKTHLKKPSRAFL